MSSISARLTGSWRGLRRARKINAILVVFILVLLALFGSFNPGFLNAGNIVNMSRQMVITAVTAFGMTAVIIARGIDLSVGSNLALAGVVGGLALRADYPPVLVFAVILLCGAFIGSVNGLLTVFVGISPFIATLGTMAACRGAALSLSNGASISINSPVLTWLGSAEVGGVPLNIFFMLLVLLAWWTIFNRMSFGRYIYAVGGNERATIASGINGRLVGFSTYVLCGLSCAVASLVLIGRTNTAQPLGGQMMENDVIAAVVIGGTLLSGGVGNVTGTFMGSIVITIIRTGLSFFGVSAAISYVVTGLVILFSVLLYQPDLLESLGLAAREKHHGRTGPRRRRRADTMRFRSETCRNPTPG